jgi:hypothetical protein
VRISLLKILIFTFTLFSCCSISSQSIGINAERKQTEFPKLNSGITRKANEFENAIAVGALLLITPTLGYENKKLYFGVGRELCLAFGKKGEFRLGAEYTFIFRSNLKNHFRVSMKYDFLSELNRGAWLDARSFVSVGAGYFLDASGIGFFPEVSAGIRIGADEGFCLYPYLKLRHTFMTKKDKPDNTDLSLGMAIGIIPF